MFAAIFSGIVYRDLIPGCRRERDLELVKCNCNSSNINHVEERNNQKKGHETNKNKKEERGMVLSSFRRNLCNEKNTNIQKPHTCIR